MVPRKHQFGAPIVWLNSPPSHTKEPIFDPLDMSDTSRISGGGFGRSGVYGTHFCVDPKEEIVAVMMCQTSIGPMRGEFGERRHAGDRQMK